MGGMQNRNRETSAAKATNINEQLTLIKRGMVFIVVMCLGLSVCLNLHVGYENRQMGKRIENLNLSMGIQREMHGMVQSLVMDLSRMSQTDPNARMLLDKYARALVRYKVLDLRKSAPE